MGSKGSRSPTSIDGFPTRTGERLCSTKTSTSPILPRRWMEPDGGEGFNEPGGADREYEEGPGRAYGSCDEADGASGWWRLLRLL